MNVKIKATEKYKWIYQDSYDIWYNNQNTIGCDNFIYFIIENCNGDFPYPFITNDEHRDKNFNDYKSMYQFFQHNLALDRNSRRTEINSLFTTSGLLFGTIDRRYICRGYDNLINYFNFDNFHLFAIQVLDIETNTVKFIVDNSVANSSIIKQLKTAINSNGFSSRKDMIYISDIHQMFVEYVEINYDLPFDKMQEEYCEEVKEFVLEELKKSINTDNINSEEPIILETQVEQIVAIDDQSPYEEMIEHIREEENNYQNESDDYPF